MNSIERELALEEQMFLMGKKRFHEAIKEAKEGPTESETVYGSALTKQLIEPVATNLQAFLDQAKEKRGRRPVAYEYIKDCDLNVLAFIGLRIILDSISTPAPVVGVAIRIGAAIEDDCRFGYFAENNSALWDVINRDLDTRTRSIEHKRGVLVRSMRKAAEKDSTMVWKDWAKDVKYYVGIALLNAVLPEEIGLITKVTKQMNGNGRAGRQDFLEPTEKAITFIEKRIKDCELLYPVYMPMVVEPKPWTTPQSGGYLSVRRRPMTLVKTRKKPYLEELTNRLMPVVYETVNAVQSTPWRVNKRVLAVMQHVWEHGKGLASIPSQEDIPLPPRPSKIKTDKQALKEWKWSARKVYDARVKQRSKRLQFTKTLWVAEKFQDEAAIYFPHQLDFRGRLYAVPSFLNPQGNDPAKALLEFAEGKPVGRDGLRWLKIHAANSFGIDKCSLEARAQWTEAHLEEIEACAADPIANTWWATTDEHPWQFLAACFELAEAMRDESYVSHLPVSVDGTCNGLQNFSAMLRDEIGGAAVNLVPSTLPQDIYQTVAEVAKKKVEADAKEGNVLAQQWLDYGFNRKAAKRPVMVLPYGGTQYSSREYVEEYLIERIQKGDKSPWEDGEVFTAASYLANHIWNSIGEVVIAARAAMAWLQQVATVAAKDGLPVNWTTPAGFAVLQAYPDFEARRVETMLGEKIVRHSIQYDKADELNRRKQASAISPNFVHSMDAAALMLCVKRCLKEGITNFSMVHDSYGTLAADMDRMAVCLREAFIELYQHDVLEEFRVSVISGLKEENAKLIPPVPPKGSLDLSAVRQSVYFFA